MALKIWTFLLVMSLPAAEHGSGFGSLASVLNSIDFHQIQQKLYSNGRNDGGKRILALAMPSTQWTGHRVDKRATSKVVNKKPHHYAMAVAASSGIPSVDGRCVARVQSALHDMMSVASTTPGIKNGNRRHTAAGGSPTSAGFMDLSGYALHQRLRTAPGAEMYVTGMRAKVMPTTRDTATAETSLQGSSGGGGGDDRPWARVDGCRYDPLGNTLEARMRFGRTLMVSGSVQLLYGGNKAGGIFPGKTGCDMTLRLRPRAGLGFTAAPLTMPEKSPPNRLTAMPTMTIRTTATFIDPEPTDDPAGAYVSVHSYNCVGGAAGFSGSNREHPAASSNHFEHYLSAEDGASDELSSGEGSSGVDDGGAASGEVGLGGGKIEIDMDDDGAGSSEFGEKRSTTPATRPFVSAGFVGLSPPSPEPRLRRIQYHSKPPQNPLLAVAAVNNHHQQTQDHLLMEMEDVFVRGVRSLLAKHMERTLKPVLKDSLMANMGYTVSYG